MRLPSRRKERNSIGFQLAVSLGTASRQRFSNSAFNSAFPRPHADGDAEVENERGKPWVSVIGVTISRTVELLAACRRISLAVVATDRISRDVLHNALLRQRTRKRDVDAGFADEVDANQPAWGPQAAAMSLLPRATASMRFPALISSRPLKRVLAFAIGEQGTSSAG